MPIPSFAPLSTLRFCSQRLQCGPNAGVSSRNGMPTLPLPVMVLSRIKLSVSRCPIAMPDSRAAMIVLFSARPNRTPQQKKMPIWLRSERFERMIGHCEPEPVRRDLRRSARIRDRNRARNPILSRTRAGRAKKLPPVATRENREQPESIDSIQPVGGPPSSSRRLRRASHSGALRTRTTPSGESSIRVNTSTQHSIRSTVPRTGAGTVQIRAVPSAEPVIAARPSKRNATERTWSL